MDFTARIARGIMPIFMRAMYDAAKAAGLPPRGTRGFSITGAAALNYMAALHIEPIGDPLWTLGMLFWRSESLRGTSDFGFAFPGLHNGKGLVIRPSKQYLWFWKGAVNVHGGVYSKNTLEAISSKDSEHQHVTAALYQKTRPLNHGHHYLQGPPRNFAMFTKNLAMQNNRYAMAWMGRRES